MAFFVATATINDREKFQRYAAAAGESLIPFAGTLVTRGQADKVLAGTQPQQTVAVVSFPSLDTLYDWYQSPAYQGLISLRDEAAEMTLTAYSAPS